MSFITNDWKYKLVALILAIMLWYTVQGQINPKTNQKFIVPIEVRNLDADKNVELEIIQASVTVNDKRMVVENLSESDIKAYVDVSEIMETENEMKKKPLLYSKSKHVYKVPIKFEIHSKYTFRVRYTSNPAYTFVKVKDTASKSMFVSLEYDSIPPLGYIYNIANMPIKSTIVTGTDSEINNVEKVCGIISNVSSEGFTGYVSLMAFDKSGKEVHSVKLEPNTIECSVNLVPQNMEKSVLVIPVFKNRLPNNLSVKEVTCYPETIQLKGYGNRFIKQHTIKTKPINLSAITKSQVINNVELDFPDGMISKQEKISVSVKVGKIN